MRISRRGFMMGCSAAIAAMAGSRVGDLAFASPTGASYNGDILVVVFLRGGCDGLSLISPYGDPRYRQLRGELALPESGPSKALTIDPRNASYSQRGVFGLHPSAKALEELYVGGELAIVHACGLDNDTRSHFDAMDFIERGTPGVKSTASGWITRHLRCVSVDGTLPTLSAGAALPTSLLGDGEAVSMASIKDFGVSSIWRYLQPDTSERDARYIPLIESLEQLYTGSSVFERAGRRAIETVRTIEQLKAQAAGGSLVYTPTPGLKYPYPEDSFGGALKTVAQAIKLDLGLQVATVDLGGWDTHEAQGSYGSGYFASLTQTLSDGLYAFYNDLAAYHSRLTVVVMSEFGRRLGANTGGGTDHGHGGSMLLLGGNVNGGKLYGRWPGLEDLDQDQDLKITTDFRAVLGEVIVNRLHNPLLGQVFPGFNAAIYEEQKPGIVNASATTLPPDFTNAGGEPVFLPLLAR
jgi:uncharacterized protein (DUF1501 family)